MIKLPPRLSEQGLRAKMLLQVHDELIFELPEAEVETTVPLIKEIMEQAALPAVDISVPLIVEAGIGDNWGDAH